MSSPVRSFLKKLWKPGVAVFYALIMLEGLWMVSAFGIYLYSVFGPAHNILETSRATRWLTDFYLSHFVDWSLSASRASSASRQSPGHTFNPFRLNIFDQRNYFWFVGFALFFIGALQIYDSKLTGRGAVTTGLYRYVRHPQYVGFILIGLPFVVIWPRYLLLVSYATMAYFYLCLALHEESLCVKRYGRPYEEYRDRTSMFLPGDRYFFGPARRLLESFLNSRAKHVAFLLVFYVLFMVCLVGVAHAFKRWTAALIPYEKRGDLAILALQGGDRRNIRPIADITEADSRVRSVLVQARAEGSNHFLVYILERENGRHFLRDRFAETRPREEWTGMSTPAYSVSTNLAGIPREDFRMVLYCGIETSPFRSLAELLDRDLRPIPLVMLGVDLREMKIMGYVDLQKKYDPRKGSRMPLV